MTLRHRLAQVLLLTLMGWLSMRVAVAAVEVRESKKLKVSGCVLRGEGIPGTLYGDQ